MRYCWESEDFILSKHQKLNEERHAIGQVWHVSLDLLPARITFVAVDNLAMYIFRSTEPLSIPLLCIVLFHEKVMLVTSRAQVRDPCKLSTDGCPNLPLPQSAIMESGGIPGNMGRIWGNGPTTDEICRSFPTFRPRRAPVKHCRALGRWAASPRMPPGRPIQASRLDDLTFGIVPESGSG